MAFWSWSRTPATNATADTTVNWAEGQAPSSVNDSARAMMARMAEYRDDISGVTVTGGAVNAYTLASYQVFDTLAHMNGQVIAFTPHITNTGAVQINVDGLGLKPYRPSPGVDFIGGELIQGTPYTGLYNHSAGEIYARGFMSSPYAVPVFGGMDFWDTVAPNSAFIFPAGQAISRTTYATAFARWGTTYGAGNGSTTFNVPDKTGKVSAMKEAASTLLTSTYFGGNSTAMGATGGSESVTLTSAQIPAHNHTATSVSTDSGHQHQVATNYGDATAGRTNGIVSAGAGSSFSAGLTLSGTANITTTTTVNNSTGGGGAHSNVPPTIICNYIIRII